MWHLHNMIFLPPAQIQHCQYPRTRSYYMLIGIKFCLAKFQLLPTNVILNLLLCSQRILLFCIIINDSVLIHSWLQISQGGLYLLLFIYSRKCGSVSNMAVVPVEWKMMTQDRILIIDTINGILCQEDFQWRNWSLTALRRWIFLEARISKSFFLKSPSSKFMQPSMAWWVACLVGRLWTPYAV